MVGLETLGGSTQGVATVGVVFLQAIALYFGYGALTRLAGSTVLNAVGGD